MIINNEIRDLARELQEPVDLDSFEDKTRNLITALRTACLKSGNQSRYQAYQNIPGELGNYPTDGEGYAVAFDPLFEEENFWEQWQKFGVVVGKQVVSPELREDTIDRIKAMIQELSEGECDFEKPETWGNLPRDKEGNPILSRGFLEIYHDHSLAELRQSVRVYLHHVLIWGREDLWTTFDRLGVKLPGHQESKALPLHVDQNPLINPYFKGIQGVLPLVDCPAERGTVVLAPGSKAVFKQYGQTAGRNRKEGDYVELNPTTDLGRLLKEYAKPLPLRAGDLVSWDSRTTHANTENISRETRMMALIAAGPAREVDFLARRAREEAFRTGLGSNEIRHRTLMAASVKPRFISPEAALKVRQTERLNLLGQLLYSQISYGTI